MSLVCTRREWVKFWGRPRDKKNRELRDLMWQIMRENYLRELGEGREPHTKRQQGTRLGAVVKQRRQGRAKG